MKIDGRKIANTIYDDLKIRVEKLIEQGIVPQIAVILIGDDPASTSYISQKSKWSNHIGVKFSLYKYSEDIQTHELLQTINKLNSDPLVHGVIIQRPLPAHIDRNIIVNAINPEKDIDGFRPDSPYDVPVAQAVVHILRETKPLDSDFTDWLKSKTIVVIGKGQTAGGPIIKYLQKLGLNPETISSTTKNPESIISTADVVISAVGKSEIIKPEFLKQNAILLGVGMYKGDDGKLHGDYITHKIEDKTSFYTPTIGGVGPVNVAYLLANLVIAAERSSIYIDTSDLLSYY